MKKTSALFKNRLLWFVGITLTALAVREWVLVMGQFHYLHGDEYSYLRLARQFIREGFSGNWVWLPGWPVIISNVLPWGGVAAVRQINVVVASLNCGLVFLIAHKLWGWKTAILAGFLICFFPEHIFYSHYVGAEIGLELIFVLFALFLVYAFSSSSPLHLLLPAFFLLGLGMLYKHFVVVPFSAAVICMLVKGRYRWILPLSLLFILPVMILAVRLKLTGGDPWFWIDSPIKSAQEWDGHRPRGPFVEGQRWQVAENQIKKGSRRTPSLLFRNTLPNIWRFWRANNYVLNRLNRYRNFRKNGFIRDFVVLYYVVVLVFSVIGVFRNWRHPFVLYASLNLILVSSLGSFLFLVSRYHTPFLFYLVLLSCSLIGIPKTAPKGR